MKTTLHETEGCFCLVVTEGKQWQEQQTAYFSCTLSNKYNCWYEKCVTLLIIYVRSDLCYHCAKHCAKLRENQGKARDLRWQVKEGH